MDGGLRLGLGCPFRLPIARSPNPVAIRQLTFSKPFKRFVPARRNLAAVVHFVPSDRIKNELTVWGDVIMERLPIDDVVRKFLQELGNQHSQCVREAAMSDTIAFERASQRRQVRRCLSSGGPFHAIRKGREKKC